VSETFNVRLIACLSATEYCSGEHVAAELGCSRTAVWKHVEELRALGVGVEARPGRGYRLREPLELLDGERILARLSPGARSSLVALKIPLDTDSTNSELQRLPAESRHAVAVLAERQAQGRGRRGRSWHSPFARNVYLSLGWRFDTGVGELGSLPLVVALAASDAIQ
jgi:BirA family biotin operon repressor/biotin-[acetyl-CoA-carboxylase] ligase